MGELIVGLIELIVHLAALLVEFFAVALEVLLNLAVISVTIIAYACSSNYRRKKQREWADKPRRKYLELGFSGACLTALVGLTIWFLMAINETSPPEMAASESAAAGIIAKVAVNGTNQTSITVKPGGLKQILETRTLSDLAGALRSNVTVIHVNDEARYITVEPISGKPSAYRFTDPDLRDRVSFTVPPDWSLSHSPTGGLAGTSCFINSSRSGANLLIDAEADESISETTSQTSLLEKLEHEDSEEEPIRVAFSKQMVDSIRNNAPASSSDGTLSVTISDAPKSDLAKIKKVAEQATVDNRMIWILHLSSPGRGEWLQALIPDSRSITHIRLYPEKDYYLASSIDLLKQIIASYSSLGGRTE